jgi:hypothetical protein
MLKNTFVLTWLTRYGRLLRECGLASAGTFVTRDTGGK